MRNISVYFGLLFGVALGACSPKLEETQRVGNPNIAVDVVIAIRQTDATVATPTEVYLVGRAQKPAGAPVFRADNVENLSVVWRSADEVVIKAKSARTFLIDEHYQLKINGKMKEFLVTTQIENEVK